MEAVDRNYKKILIFLLAGIGVSALIILGFIIAPLFSGAKKPAILSLNIAPSTATIELNGEELHVGAYDNLEPGNYTATIHQDGFESKEISFTLTTGETTTIYEYILSETEGFNYFEKNRSDINTLREIKDNDDVKTFLDKYDKKLAIKQVLPILLNDYDPVRARLITGEITDGSNNPKCTYAFCLQVNVGKDMEWRAKQVVELAGFNYDDYEVIYAD
jgi:hypothetical protein